MTTYDTATDAGKVRLLIPDTSTTTATFSDAEILVFLVIGGNDIFLAAAIALETRAAKEALVLKDMTGQGVRTNGATVCAALLERAKMLRQMAGSGALVGDAGFAGGEYVGVASAAVDEFTYREMVG